MATSKPLMHTTPERRSVPSKVSVRSARVPIRCLDKAHRQRIAEHVLALEPQDRYLRFGHVASDEQIGRYVAGLDFERDAIFGIYNRKLVLIAVAHLAFSGHVQFASCAEFGVSVLTHARGRGYGSRLFERAVVHARNQGVRMLFIHALSQNTVMLNIVRRAGASITRDRSESAAYLHLPPGDLGSQMSELVQEQMAQTDYQLKAQAKQFWEMLAALQEVRRGVQQAREHTRA